MNHEKGGETHLSPRRVLREKRAHCIEGALLAAAALWLHGEKPLIMDLVADKSRYDDGKHGSGKFLEGSAYIVPDQWCTFRAGDQTLAAQVTDGNLVFTGDQVIDLNVTAAGVGGHVQWSTHGAISP